MNTHPDLVTARTHLLAAHDLFRHFFPVHSEQQQEHLTQLMHSTYEWNRGASVTAVRHEGHQTVGALKEDILINLTHALTGNITFREPVDPGIEAEARDAALEILKSIRILRGLPAETPA